MEKGDGEVSAVFCSACEARQRPSTPTLKRLRSIDPFLPSSARPRLPAPLNELQGLRSEGDESACGRNSNYESGPPVPRGGAPSVVVLAGAGVGPEGQAGPLLKLGQHLGAGWGELQFRFVLMRGLRNGGCPSEAS